jgi:hypothetical protein
MGLVAKANYTLASIDNLFKSAGAMEDWRVESLQYYSSERVTRIYGWIEGTELWAPDRVQRIVTDAVQAMLVELPISENRTALELGVDRVKQRALEPQPHVGDVGPFVLPPGYEYLAPDCRDFLDAYPEYEHNVFLMMRFGREPAIKNLVGEIRSILGESGLKVHRADDRNFSRRRNMWDNICIYMLCCRHGIAILEDHYVKEFNANVAIEYGFMVALNKQPLLLKDRGFERLKADVMGTLYESFDIADATGSVRTPLENWLRDIGVPPIMS